jgi:hypothetical protein
MPETRATSRARFRIQSERSSQTLASTCMRVLTSIPSTKSRRASQGASRRAAQPRSYGWGTARGTCSLSCMTSIRRSLSTACGAPRYATSVRLTLPSAASEVLPAYHATLRSAHLIGFPGPFGALLRRSNPEVYLRPIQGLVSVHGYLTRFAGELELGSKTGAPAGFHRGLLPHYEGLISGRKIGIVTCYRSCKAHCEHGLARPPSTCALYPGRRSSRRIPQRIPATGPTVSGS